MRYRRGYFLILLLAAMAAASSARGDDPPAVPPIKPQPATGRTAIPDGAAPATAAPAPDSAAAATVTEVKPELLFLRDKDGRLVPVPGFSYDDFVKYYRLKEQIERPETKPRFSLEQLIIGGSAAVDRAELTVTVKVLLTDSDWARIPLRMNKWALREPAGYKGAGDQFLQFDPGGDGYVCWLRGAARSEHELTLKLAAPLTTTAGETRLDFTLPRAAASKLTLQLPTPNPVATASAGNSSPEIASDGDGSRISILGVGGDCWLAWRGPDQPLVKLSSALEATGLLLIKIDGRSVISEATLSVRSFGSEFDHFRVRLPPGAQLTGGQQPGYTLVPAGNPGTPVVDVRLDRKTAGPIEVRLLTERAYDVTKRGESLELAGFSVVEAIPHRQWGHIAVAVSGDWQLVWGEPARIRQVDELPEALRRKDLTAGFEYFGQPSSLPVRVVSRKTRLIVDPQFVYRVGPERTDLEARLKYSIRGARVFKLDLDLAGWEIDSVGPEDHVDVNAIVSSPGGTFTIPLLQPSIGDLELTLKAHRANAPGMKTIEWTLPEPRADVHGPADVTIIPAENIDLNPQTDRFIGLSRAAAGPMGDAGAATLAYRAEQSHARFVAGFTVHSQSISVEADSQVTLRARRIEVDQSLNYQILYQPADRLSLDVPRALFDAQGLRFSVAGEPVEAREVGEQPSADRRSVQLPLKLTTGPVRVEVHYSLPEAALADSVSAVGIPFVVPTDVRVTANRATVTADPGIRMEQREGPWSVLDASKPMSGPQTTLRFSAPEAAPELRLAIGLDPRQAAGTTFIDRAWIQCWLTESVRQDRAVYRLTSDDDQLRVTLPPGISAGDVEVVLDGKAATPTASSPGTLVVGLQNDLVRREHLLELRYQFEARGAQSGWLSFDVPRFDSHVRVRRTYWQLVLPQDETLVSGSGGTTAEFNWAWDDHGFGFKRVPMKEQRQLEDWVGLNRSTAIAAPRSNDSDEVSERTNRYLFSTVGSNDRFEVVVARRWLVMLVASLGSLLAGLLLIYVPALRQPRPLFAAACLLLLIVLIWPDAAVLATEAASLGIGLALLAAALRRAVGGRSEPESSAAVNSPILERSSRRIRQPIADEGELVTSTASIAVGIAADEAGRDDRQPDSGSGRGVGGSSPELSAESS